MHTSDHTLEVKLENVSAKDAEFLTAVLSLFTDPKHRTIAEILRTGTIAIQYHPDTGRLCVFDAKKYETGPSEIIGFISRFTEIEWQSLREERSVNWMECLRVSLGAAEAHARRILGYLPPAAPYLDIGNG
jgi:hypothetical protein